MREDDVSIQVFRVSKRFVQRLKYGIIQSVLSNSDDIIRRLLKVYSAVQVFSGFPEQFECKE